MPTPLPSPYMAEAGPVLQAWRTGQSDRLDAQQRGALQEAGKMAATGSLSGARQHLLGQGMFDEANQIAAMMKQADDATLTKAKRTYEVLGNLALASDTPEKWQAALAAASKAGMDVSKYQDFGARDMVLAQAGMVSDSIANQFKERALNAKDKPIEINGNLVERQPDGSYKSVYAAPPKQEGLMSVSPGQTILDPNTRQPVYTAPAKEEGLMSVAPGNTVLDPATRQPVFSAPEKTVDRAPAGYRPTPDGNLTYIPGGPADPATNNRQVKYNEGQTKAANFGKMMTEAEKLVGDQASPIGFWGQVSENVTPEVLSNQMRSPEYQKYRQAADQWIRAKLRKESGATITPEESEGEFRTFFPQPGDSPEVITQKKAARQQAIQGMVAESGGAYEQSFSPNQAAPAGAVQPPQPGEVQDGYRFKGGNPGDPNSWEKVQ